VPSLRARYLSYVRDIAENRSIGRSSADRAAAPFAHRRRPEADTRKLDSLEDFEKRPRLDTQAEDSADPVAARSVLKDFADRDGPTC